MNTEIRNISIDIIGIIAIAILGVSFGACVGRIALRQEAAKEGVGEYSVNPLTGSARFQWKRAVTNDPSPSATALALKFSVYNAENVRELVKLNETMVQKIIDLSRRVAELEQKRYEQFLQPRWDGQVLTNTWPPQWQTSTNIDIIQSGTNMYMTNLYLGQGITITNGMLYIQN